MSQVDQIRANAQGLIGALHHHAQLVNKKKPEEFEYILAREADTDSPAPFSADPSVGTFINLEKVQATLRKAAQEKIFGFEQRTGYGQIRSDWASLLSEETIKTLCEFAALIIVSGNKTLDDIQLTPKEIKGLSQIFKALAKEKPPNFSMGLARAFDMNQIDKSEIESFCKGLAQLPFCKGPVIVEPTQTPNGSAVVVKMPLDNERAFTHISAALNHYLVHKQCCIN